MNQFGQQPGYSQQPFGNQQPAYGQPQGYPQPQMSQPHGAPVRLSKENPVFRLADAMRQGSRFTAILNWDGRGVPLDKVVTLPPGYSQQPFGNSGQPQYGAPAFGNQQPAYGQPQGYPQPQQPSEIDLDVSAALLLADQNRVITDQYYVFYNNQKSPEGRVLVLSGDNRTGAGGDDEILRVDLEELTPHPGQAVQYKVSVMASVYNKPGAPVKSFKDIRKAEITIIGPNGVPLATYDLDASGGEAQAVLFGEFVYDIRHGGWHFTAIGKHYHDLATYMKSVGVNV